MTADPPANQGPSKRMTHHGNCGSRLRGHTTWQSSYDRSEPTPLPAQRRGLCPAVRPGLRPGHRNGRTALVLAAVVPVNLRPGNRFLADRDPPHRRRANRGRPVAVYAKVFIPRTAPVLLRSRGCSSTARKKHLPQAQQSLCERLHVIRRMLVCSVALSVLALGAPWPPRLLRLPPLRRPPNRRSRYLPTPGR